ncbi:MAG: hypothetical protein FJ279_04950 [Planctomycetes bacterium]|nr:hypothetical protein [Planctomycetota bacterium]
MKWPKVDPRESFEDMEKRLGIRKEADDVRRTSLGAHPSESFYSKKEPKVDLARMRAKFDKVAERY